MDWIPAKIRLIRQQFQMTQLELAQASGLSQRDISQLENGRKEGVPKEFIRFLHTRGVDLNWLFTDPAEEVGQALAPAKGYTAAEPGAALLVEEERVGYGASPKKAAPVAELRMVDAAAAAQYAARCVEPAFEQTLPALTLPLPQVQQGRFRCFQVTDTSLQPDFQLHDWVIARLLTPKPSVNQLDPAAIYVVVTVQRLAIGRLTPAVAGAVQLVVEAGQAGAEFTWAHVQELWLVTGRLSFQLPAPAPDTLAAQLHNLLERVQRLERER
ncbi:helix-turn-helix domain-containing protein [Hymenobacter persicinus]|uniref:XRE family transcriptional regulator n=1 Tax=Hymenobacter persicinus TaxID=2025506 RepID=A0A4Q5L9S2_9BACT|nr:helix-turn-helix transcriptional regulator [Hymenobacter persicinus]RYU77811.1 XRE family transcriptional regulator [Hymenobacter persicinus]